MHERMHDDAQIIRLVDSLLVAAVKDRASDIHLEPTIHGLRVRFRIDGVLHDQELCNAAHTQRIISRLKVLAQLDITEKRVPQDGKFQISHNRHVIDLRVSTFPSFHGEKIVVRILDQARMALHLNQLGFSETMLAAVNELLSKASGFFLVAGPTGSGKTTTLYAALSAINTASKNTITLEDPIEYHIEGITQGQINPDVGFTFERGIRALLRQDPDIVMIGEIRDKQTAQIAIEAALTGHVVMSTVHTNDAPTVIMRLMDMEIEPFLINAAITGILAQRLARTICKKCSQCAQPNEKEKIILDRFKSPIKTLYRGVGCQECRYTGYKGRTGIFELLPITHDLRSLIVLNPSFEAIVRQAHAQGLRSLQEDGLDKVEKGIISLDEFLRVVF